MDIEVGNTVRICKVDTARYGKTGEVLRVGGDHFFPVQVRFPDGVQLGYMETDVQVIDRG